MPPTTQTPLHPLPIRVAQAVGLTAAAFLSGKTFAQSFTTIPALLEAPAPLLTKQWKRMFDADKLLAPALVVLTSSVFGYLAYKEPTSQISRFRLYTAATALLLSTIPYSLLALEPLNQKLEDKASSLAKASITDASAEVGVAEEETTHFLVDRWATVNLGRSILSGVAAVVGAWGIVSWD